MFRSHYTDAVAAFGGTAGGEFIKKTLKSRFDLTVSGGRKVTKVRFIKTIATH